MKRLFACIVSAALLAGCGSGSLLQGNSGALATSVGAKLTAPAVNAVSGKPVSGHLSGTINSVRSASAGTDDVELNDFADFITFEQQGIPKDAEFPTLKYAEGEWRYYLDLLDPDTGDAYFAEFGFADLSLNYGKESVIIELDPRYDADEYELYPVTAEEIGYEQFEGGFDEDGALRLSGNDVVLYITQYFAWSGREYICGETWYSEEDYGAFYMVRGQQ